MEWISVKDKMPKEYGRYLVYQQHPNGEWKDIKLLWYNVQRDYWSFEGMDSLHVPDITHWMQLPQPPQ